MSFGWRGRAAVCRGPASHSQCDPRPRRIWPLLGCAQLFDDVLERRDDLVLLDPGLLEAEAEIERLRGRSEGKDKVLRAARLRLRGFLPDVVARRGALAS